MRCAFCDKEFDADRPTACVRCAMFGGCKMIKCPHCGYEMPQETRLVKWMRQWLTRTK